MVPFLYLLYARLGVARDPATTLAHATSLAVIVPTAIRGLIGYRGQLLTDTVARRCSTRSARATGRGPARSPTGRTACS